MIPFSGKLLALFVILSFLLGSCSSSKYLREDESLLVKNKLKIDTEISEDKKNSLAFELSTFYRQKPNTNFMFLFPREWYYFANEGDSSWYNNWARNYLGETPSIFRESESFKTSESMENYLRNKKGFYNAEVDYSVTTQNKSTEVKYLIETGPLYTVASLDYIGEDEKLIQVVKGFENSSIIKVGDPIDAGLFDQEKNRIANRLQNLGYANFVPNYINIIGDSTNHAHAVDILIEIRNPGVNQTHKKYRVGNVNIFTDYFQGQNTDQLISKEMHDLIFKRSTPEFYVRPSRINERVSIRRGDLYRRSEQNKSFRKLSTLDAYRFVTVTPSVSSESDSIVDVNIFMTPYQTRWISDTGINLFYSTISASGRRLFGFSVDGSLKNRNIFGGAEVFSLDGELGYEFDFSPTVKTSAITGNLQSNLQIPKMLDPFKTVKALNAIGVLSDDNLSEFKDQTTTRISLGYSQTNIIDFYNLRTINASFGYDFRPTTNQTFLIRTFGIDFNDYQLEQSFLDRIDDNPLITNSFESNYFTGFLFRNLSYLYQAPKNAKGFSWAQIANIELSGWEILLANKLLDSGNEWRFNDNYDFSQFLKLELDTRVYKDLFGESSLALRANAGIAFPLRSTQQVPFPKQFYVGGPNSIRAWQLRELGPGGHSELLLNPIANQLFYQQGDIKLEFNIEYRYELFWILESAFFIDAGNVWTRSEDETRPGAQFTSDFYKQIAVGAGWGLRWDFKYFLIRFDFGYRLRNPFPHPEKGNYWQPLNTFKFLGNVNIAVNYPF